MSDHPADSDLPGPDPESSEEPDLSLAFPKVDLSAILPQPVDLSAILPQPVDLSAILPQPVDLSAILPQPVDLSAILPQPVDLSALLPKVDLSLLFPRLDASALFPWIDLSYLVDQVDSPILARITEADIGYGTDTESSSAVVQKGSDHRGLSDREVAAMLTVFIFLVVCIGLSVAVKDYPKVATIARITGASPFDVAMGFGALAFWVAYSRRSS